MTNLVYQFKVALEDIEPVIWRRILVPKAYSFWDLHVAIQDAMGWLDYHLHLFTIRRKHARHPTEIGIPSGEGSVGGPDCLPGWDVPITAYFTEIGMVAQYTYDFGDGWRHELLFEGILLREKGEKYPKCIAGERACPPEDCGGVPGYHRLLEAIADPEHEEHDESITWLGGEYVPDRFSPGDVRFDNPRTRLRRTFG